MQRIYIIFCTISCALLSACATWFYETAPLQFNLKDGKGNFEARYWKNYTVRVKLTIHDKNKDFCEAAQLLRWETPSCKSNNNNRPMKFTWKIRDATSDTIVNQGSGWKINNCSAVGYQVEIWCSIISFEAKEGHNFEISVDNVNMPESGWKLNPIIFVDAAAGNVWQH
jgi:hypothetical protein